MQYAFVLDIFVFATLLICIGSTLFFWRAELSNAILNFLTTSLVGVELQFAVLWKHIKANSMYIWSGA